MSESSLSEDALRRKYESVLRTIEREGISLSQVQMRDGKLLIRGTAPSEEAGRRIWDQAAQTDPRWEHDLFLDIRTEAQQTAQTHTGQTVVNSAQGFTNRGQDPPANQTYVVREGDSLDQISRQFYGDPRQSAKILEANRDALGASGGLQPGQVLTIPR